MRIVQSTWVRFHHFDLARELHRLGHLERIFTCLPWWKADKESREQGIPRELISCNWYVHGVRHVTRRLPGFPATLDGFLSVAQTRIFSRWVARNLPECDAYIGLSGSGLHAGRVAQSRGAGYVMDRGSTQARWGEREDKSECERWRVPFHPTPEWLIANEEEEQGQADLITVPSDFAARTFVETGTDSNKLRVVPYGVHLSEFSPSGRPPDDEFRLVFVGGVGLRKGVGYLLEAFRDFPHPRKRLYVVGAVQPSVRPLIHAIGVDRVDFVGVVPRREVVGYMSRAHALVLPSIHEGLALVIGQAMACGCPVIASVGTGFENIGKHEVHGLVVPRKDTRALVDAFTRLSDEPSMRRRMSEACLERVKQLGGWKTYGRGMAEVAAEAARKASAMRSAS